MTPERVLMALPGVTCTRAYDAVIADVERTGWVTAATAAREDLALTYFDVLTAVDLLADGFEVVLRVWSVEHREGLLLRTRCPREDPFVPSLSGVFAGAAWHERGAAEMFAITFAGHPGLTPLLLPADFAGAPLRKDFLLAARVQTPWPGAKEPGESDADLIGRPPRRKNLPPGVPPPGRT